MQNEISNLLLEGAAELGVLLTNQQISAFSKYLEELGSWGKKINLIRRVDDREIILKDFLDSLTILKYLNPYASVADLGSGAGFPGVPIAITRPDLRIALLEATRKKADFLKNLVRCLKLEGTKVYWTGEKGRREKDLCGNFDFVVSRAFGTLRRFSVAGIPLLKPGGILLAMKGRRGRAELEEERQFLEKRGLGLAFFSHFRLPILNHDRSLIGLRKG